MTHLSYRSPECFPGSRGHWEGHPGALDGFSLPPVALVMFLAILVSLESQVRESPVPSQAKDYCHSPKPTPSFPSVHSYTTFPSPSCSGMELSEFLPKTKGGSDVPHFLTWPMKCSVCSLALSLSLSPPSGQLQCLKQRWEAHAEDARASVILGPRNDCLEKGFPTPAPPHTPGYSCPRPPPTYQSLCQHIIV